MIGCTSARRAAGERLHHEQRSGEPVAGRREVGPDDVAGLLTADRPLTAQQLLDHAAIADLGRRDLDPGLLHRLVEAVVGHHRDRGAAGELADLLQVQGGDRDDLVAVDLAALGVDGEDPVAVAVVGEAELGALAADDLGDVAPGGWSRSPR